MSTREKAVHVLRTTTLPNVQFSNVIETLEGSKEGQVGIPKYMAGILNEPDVLGTGIRFCTLEQDLLVDLYQGVMDKKIEVKGLRVLLKEQTHQFLNMYSINWNQKQVLGEIERAVRAANMTYLDPHRPFDTDVYLDKMNDVIENLLLAPDNSAVRGYLLCKVVGVMDLLLAIKRNTTGNWN